MPGRIYIYCLTFFAVVVAGIVRWLLDPLLGDHVPYPPFFIAVIFAAWFGGLRPALLATFSGAVVAAFFFVPPRWSFAIAGPQHVVGLVLYSIVGFAFAAFGDSLRSARRRSEESEARALQQVAEGRKTEQAIRDREAELRDARSRLESTLEAGEIGTWEYDVSSHCVFADRNLATMFGLPRHEAIGEPIETYLQAIHPADRERVSGAISRAIKSGDGYETDYRLVGPGGDLRWVIARGRVVRDEHGRAVRLPSVVVDVTGQRRAEEELRASEERRRLALDSAELGAWQVDPATMTLTTDDRFRAIFGVKEQRFEYEQAVAVIHPDDQARVRDAVAEATRPDDPTPYAVEYRVVHPDGAIRWVFAKGRANFEQTESGRTLVSFDGTVSDITARKLAEEERQKLVVLAENSTDFIGMCDMEFAPTFINRAGLEMVGLEGFDEFRKTPIQEFFFPEDHERILNEFLPAVLERGHGEIEVRFRHFQTGKALWMLFRVFTLYDSEGGKTGLATVSRDITDRKRLENHLRQLAADLSEADHRKDEFLATLAHELRNPLAPIRNGLEVQRMANGDAGIIEDARSMMDRQLDQMVRLVDDLMDVSRITRGKLELKTERVPLLSVLNSAVETSRHLIEQMEHSLTVTLPEIPIYVNADLTRLSQVFQNLLNNSAKYSDRGSHVWLTAEREGDQVIVSVRDTGVGIAADQLPRIFDLFTQVDRSLDKAQGGLGIGLSLVKRLVEMHGGSIEVRSEGVGQGSEFRVSLPVIMEAPPTPAVSQVESRKSKSGLRILIVDDNRDGADSLAMMLKVFGNQTFTAYDGEQAVTAAGNVRPDVVLLDIGLPKLNGHEACRQMRELPDGDKFLIIAQTGWGQEEDRRRTAESGFDHHLVKPVDPHALMKLLAELSKTVPG